MLFVDNAPEFTVLPLKLFLTWMKSRLGMGSNQVGICVCVVREALLSEITLLSLFLFLFSFSFLFTLIFLLFFIKSITELSPSDFQSKVKKDTRKNYKIRAELRRWQPVKR